MLWFMVKHGDFTLCRHELRNVALTNSLRHIFD